MKNLVIVSGKARSGKDTFFEQAREILGSEEVRRIALGDYVKLFVQHLYPDQLTGEKEKDRELYIRAGDGVRKYIGVDIWCKCWRRENAELFTGTSVLVDCRYPSEIAWFSALHKAAFPNGRLTVVRVNRSKESGLTEANKVHATETSLDNWDFKHVYQNDGTLEDYSIFVQGILNGN